MYSFLFNLTYGKRNKQKFGILSSISALIHLLLAYLNEADRMYGHQSIYLLDLATEGRLTPVAFSV